MEPTNRYYNTKDRNYNLKYSQEEYFKSDFWYNP